MEAQFLELLFLGFGIVESSWFCVYKIIFSHGFPSKGQLRKGGNICGLVLGECISQ